MVLFEGVGADGRDDPALAGNARLGEGSGGRREGGGKVEGRATGRYGVRKE